jgi:GTP pyrophosphokinase
LAGLGSGDVKMSQVINYGRRVLPQPDIPLQNIPIHTKFHKETAGGSDTVSVQGVNNLMTVIAGCCHPLPGDAVIGYVTQGRGISIHRIDCPHINKTRETRPERIVNVEWGAGKERYPVDMVIISVDRPHVLRDITHLIANEKVNILGMNSRVDQKNNQVVTSVRVELANLSGLGKLCEKLSQVPDVLDVKRSNLLQ